MYAERSPLPRVRNSLHTGPANPGAHRTIRRTILSAPQTLPNHRSADQRHRPAPVKPHDASRPVPLCLPQPWPNAILLKQNRERIRKKKENVITESYSCPYRSSPIQAGVALK
ncbi:hypothetical protein F4775DRAFT_533298 [Biscogniauxia sp. FL1348]|nr:hypothetical protein F4775DRAFT_533298 [Biscogniauxia sp. FL1348]